MTPGLTVAADGGSGVILGSGGGTERKLTVGVEGCPGGVVDWWRGIGGSG